MSRKRPSTRGLHTFGIYLGVYDYTVNFVLGKNCKEVEAWVRWKHERPDTWEWNRGVKGCVFFTEGYAPIMWLPGVPRTNDEKGTLAHECFHVACEVLRWCHVRFCDESEEAYAHLMTALFNGALVRMGRLSRKK